MFKKLMEYFNSTTYDEVLKEIRENNILLYNKNI